MSAIASFYLLDRSAIPGLLQAANSEPIAIPAATPARSGISYLRSRFGRRNPTPLIVVSPVSNYLDENDLGVSGGLYDWSGYALLYLMGLLEETGTPLGTAEYRAEAETVNAAYDTTFLITSADKRHLPALDPARLDQSAAERYFNDRSHRFEEIRQAIDEGLVLLHRLITALKDNEVLVINIG
jgi:hypothetical protein